MSYIKILIIFYLITLISNKKGQKQSSKFELAFKSCQTKGSLCELKKFDDDCVYKCLSNTCYTAIFKNNKINNNDILEFGEINLSKRVIFEQCWNKEKKN